MSNEPKAGTGIDPELLAAYIDHTLSPEQRAVVEAQLAANPESYAVLADTLKAIEDESIDELEVKAPGQVPSVPVVTLVPKAKRAPMRWGIAGAIAAAAALLFVVRMQPDWLAGLQGDSVDQNLERLVSAVGPERYLEARLTGGFRYGPLRTATRGAGQVSQQNLALRSLAAEMQQRATAQPSAESLHAYGIAELLLGLDENAIAVLERSLQMRRSGPVLTNLAAAYAARGARGGERSDWESAHRYATEALGYPNSVRAPALFNRALAASNLGLPSAVEAWREYLSAELDPQWQSLGRQYLEALPADTRR